MSDKRTIRIIPPRVLPPMISADDLIDSFLVDDGHQQMPLRQYIVQLNAVAEAARAVVDGLYYDGEIINVDIGAIDDDAVSRLLDKLAALDDPDA